MDIKVSTPKKENDALHATLTVSAAAVDEAIAQVYKEIAHKYKFQGFRQGKAPRPVIDSMVGRPAVLADATNVVLEQAEPLLFHELDVVPMGHVTLGKEGENAPHVALGEDYVVDVTIPVRPDFELSDYKPVAIQMPPEKATPAEVEQQTEMLLSLQANLGQDTATAKDSKDAKGADKEAEAGDKGSDAADKGEKDTKDTKDTKASNKTAKKSATPTLTDEIAKEAFGFESAAAFTEAITKEIQQDKDAHLGRLKETRALEALVKRLGDKKPPEAYVDEVFQENARMFMNNLQAQGQTVDSFIQMRGIKMEQLLDDMKKQAAEQALQGLALDALAKELKIQTTDDDVKEEFAGVYKSDKERDRALEEFVRSGRVPAIKEAIKRQRALKWLVDNAQVTEVDEIAEKRK